MFQVMLITCPDESEQRGAGACGGERLYAASLAADLVGRPCSALPRASTRAACQHLYISRAAISIHMTATSKRIGKRIWQLSICCCSLCRKRCQPNVRSREGIFPDCFLRAISAAALRPDIAFAFLAWDSMLNSKA